MSKPLRIVIVEDEPASARALRAALLGCDREISVEAMLDSVSAAVSWFRENNAAPDLIFMDIRLGDGLSFDIFRQVEIVQPVIFVTAYNEYALQAFKANGIDYLLKPFDDEELINAIDKFSRLSAKAPTDKFFDDLQQVLAKVSSPTSYKRSFLVHFKDKLIPLVADDIAWFHTAFEVVHAHTTDGRMYAIELTMEQLEQQLDPSLFFRSSRQYIIHRRCIREIESHFGGRLAVRVHPAPQEPVIVSKARVPIFKAWMNA
ncbi:MAG: response regulator transcription factor [Taibaiella sp.]|nr:response regulator transcription factor [Taibaiella sp.]